MHWVLETYYTWCCFVLLHCIGGGTLTIETFNSAHISHSNSSCETEQGPPALCLLTVLSMSLNYLYLKLRPLPCSLPDCQAPLCLLVSSTFDFLSVNTFLLFFHSFTWGQPGPEYFPNIQPFRKLAGELSPKWPRLLLSDGNTHHCGEKQDSFKVPVSSFPNLMWSKAEFPPGCPMMSAADLQHTAWRVEKNVFKKMEYVQIKAFIL